MNADHESFLRPFFLEMNTVFPGKWCVLHSYETLPQYSESDVDMAFSDTKIGRLEVLLLKVAEDSGFRVHQKLWYDLQHCLYYVLKHKDEDIFLALDFLIDNAGVGKYGFKTDILTHECTLVKNLFPIPSPGIAFYYKLVKRIVKKRSLTEDEQYLKSHYRSSDPDVILKYITNEFGQKGKQLIIEYLKEEGKRLTEGEIEYLNAVRKKKKRENRNQVHYAFWEARRMINRVRYPGGVLVSVPELPADVLAQFMDALSVKVNILFRFVQLQKQNSLKQNFMALAGSTLLINPSGKFDSGKAVRFKWMGNCYYEVDYDLAMNDDAIDHMVDQYYNAILEATYQRVLRRLSNGK